MDTPILLPTPDRSDTAPKWFTRMPPMLNAPWPQRIVALAAALFAADFLGGCGQKGPLFVPHTPAAAQRATLPQTAFGGTDAPPPAATASQPAAARLPPPLPDLPEIR